MIKLWLDDIRVPENGWTWVKTVEAAQNILENQVVDVVSLDHDLGTGEQTGYTLACWIEEQVYTGKIKQIKMFCHSANPVGRRRIGLVIHSVQKMLAKQ